MVALGKGVGKSDQPTRLKKSRAAKGFVVAEVRGFFYASLPL